MNRGGTPFHPSAFILHPYIPAPRPIPLPCVQGRGDRRPAAPMIAERRPKRGLMNQDQWTAVGRYFTDLLIPADSALDAALRASEAAGLPAIHVSANQGKLLHLLARAQGARRVLEIGTLGGYSTIWLARALPTAPD